MEKNWSRMKPENEELMDIVEEVEIKEEERNIEFIL